jgi:hypothetical protein
MAIDTTAGEQGAPETWVIARDLNDEPRTIYWRGVDTPCGNLAWGPLTMNPLTWPTRAEAQAAWGAAREAAAQLMASTWRPPAARALKLSAADVRGAL